MALTCGGSCMKMLLFVFNGLFFYFVCMCCKGVEAETMFIQQMIDGTKRQGTPMAQT